MSVMLNQNLYFLGLKTAGPDTVDFRLYCSVSDYAVVTDGDEWTSVTKNFISLIINITTNNTKVIARVSSSTKIKRIRNSHKARYDTVLIKYPIISKQINGDGFPPIRKDYIAEKNQMLRFSFIVCTRNKKFFIQVSDKTFRWNFFCLPV